MTPDIIDEALRYLGVRNEEIGMLQAQMTALAAELSSRITPRWTWRVFPITSDSSIYLGNISLSGHSAATMLVECSQCALLVCHHGRLVDLTIVVDTK